MIRNPLLLPKTRIYDFEPHTFGSDSKKRKKEISNIYSTENIKYVVVRVIIRINCSNSKMLVESGS